jgi:hypothetical protein
MGEDHRSGWWQKFSWLKITMKPETQRWAGTEARPTIKSAFQVRHFAAIADQQPGPNKGSLRWEKILEDRYGWH